MADVRDEDSEPTPERVAARALVLSAVSCRGAIEKDAGKPGAEKLRQLMLPWLERIGIADELEPAEISLISTPLGMLDQKNCRNASWQSEGMAVLAWALRLVELPLPHIQCDPAGTANSMGFLDERENTAIHRPVLRHKDEIGMSTDTYMTLHWRLRLLDSHPGPMDYVSCVEAVTWYPLRLDQLELVDNDIAIEGIRIDRIETRKCRQILGIVRERHKALNWLVGFEEVYSQVTTDT